MTDPLSLSSSRPPADGSRVQARLAVAAAHRDQVVPARSGGFPPFELRSIRRGALELVGSGFVPKQTLVEVAVTDGAGAVGTGWIGTVRKVSLAGPEPSYTLVVQVEQGDLQELARRVTGALARPAPPRHTEFRLAGAAALPGWASLLVEHGIVSEVELRRCATQARSQSIELADLLGPIVPGEQLAVCRALDVGVPFVDPRSFRVNEANAALVPREVSLRHGVFPLFDVGGTLTLGMKDPTDLALIDQIRLRTKRQVDPCLCPASLLDVLIGQVYDAAGPAPATPARRSPLMRERADDAEGDSSEVAKAVRSLLEQAAGRGASDVHLEPERDYLRVRARVDGVLHEFARLPIERHAAIVSRIKVQAKLDIAESRRPQDGHFTTRAGSGEVDVRVSTLPTVQGENVVMRLIHAESEALGLDQLELPDSIRSSFERHLAAPSGMVLVTGPTGSGKTTTLYAGLERLNDVQRSIVTIEDPVERRVELLRQIQVNPRVGLTFASGLRSVLRQDPDVIMVGEIRDQETAEIAVQASLTGHLVLSTLHTNSAAGAIVRLTEMGIAPFLLTSSLRAVIGQRLVRHVCPECAQEVRPDPELVRGLGIAPDALPIVRVGRGCGACMDTGYRGRLGVYELVELTGELARTILAGAGREEVERVAAAEGGTNLRRAGLARVREGRTTLAEVARIVGLEGRPAA